jgi:hypothetical protein
VLVPLVSRLIHALIASVPSMPAQALSDPNKKSPSSMVRVSTDDASSGPRDGKTLLTSSSTPTAGPRAPASRANVLANGNGNGNGHALVEDEEESLSRPRGFFADQFEVCIGNFALAVTNVDILSPSPQNRSNFAAVFTGRGPEIWRQTNGKVTAFVAGAGR